MSASSPRSIRMRRVVITGTTGLKPPYSQSIKRLVSNT
jgi:hypothetical protein